MFDELIGRDGFDVWPHLIALAVAYVLALPTAGTASERREARASGRFRW